MVVRVYWKCRGGSEHVKGSSSRGNEQRRTALGGPQSGIYTGVNQGAQCASASQQSQRRGSALTSHRKSIYTGKGGLCGGVAACWRRPARYQRGCGLGCGDASVV
ncbi:hypothetical protein IG631_05810 [Alternaria alternata]|nr:hypothetical protein IG631_05810 [Alternaria alternata]